MPQLDVSFVVSDPMLADTFTVLRQTETVGATGRLTSTETSYPGIVGVITAQDPAELAMRDDGIMSPRNIFVATRFALHGPGPGHQPDIISYSGTKYKVKHLMAFSRFGRGTYEALAESFKAVDPDQ